MTSFNMDWNTGEKARIDKNLREIAKGTKGVAKTVASKEMAKKIMQSARKSCPSARVAGSFKIVQKGNKWAVINYHPIAHYLEYGTRPGKQGPTRGYFFMRNAAMSAKYGAAKAAMRKLGSFMKRFTK